MKMVFFGTFGTESSDRDLAVRRLFRDAGFSISTSRYSRSWLLSHFLFDAAFGVEVLKAGGISQAMDSSRSAGDMVIGLRELIPILKARGAKVERGAIGILARLPVGLTGLLLRSVAYRKGTLSRELMEAFALGKAPLEDQKLYPRETLAEARRLGIPVPRLKAAEDLFREGVRSSRRPGMEVEGCRCTLT